jgi:curved DNA-binding protein CbpA
MALDASIASWLAVLDKVSYYELLGVQPGSGGDTVHRAYQGFAATFHPDAHGYRSREDRDSVNKIFKRGTEAYRVLSDAALRARYDEQRTGRPSAAGPTQRPAPLPPQSLTPAKSGTTIPPASAGPRPGSASKIAGRLEDFVKNPKARPYAQQAEALAKKGEHGKAKLQLKLAMNFDQGNPALEAYLKELDVLIQQDKNKPYQPK